MVDAIECPRHEGNFDCTPFCDICEGEQELTGEITDRQLSAVISKDIFGV